MIESALTSTNAGDAVQPQAQSALEPEEISADTTRAMTTPVLAATTWNSNAELIADMARLGYIGLDDLVLDATYGRGVWWKQYRPKRLITNDLTKPADLRADFRNLPFADGTFDVVAYDPPYVSVGGRTSTGMPEFHDRFGLTDAPGSPAGVQQLINAGLDEAARVVRPGGIVLVKIQDYISSGKLWIGTTLTHVHALELGFETVDRIEHVSSSPRPQPPRRRQVHSRRNLSTLFVLKAPRRQP